MKKEKKKIDYEKLVAQIGSCEVTTEEIEKLAEVSHNSLRHVIDTLSITYTLYDVRHGVYKLLVPPKGNSDVK